jgi:hypothetical protein
MPTSPTAFRDELELRAHKIRETFGLRSNEDLTTGALQRFDISEEVLTHLAAFNIEWHVVPSTSVVPFDDAYLAKMYPLRSKDFGEVPYEALSVRQMLAFAHARVQGMLVGIETTQKPTYLPDHHQQFYGTTNGLDPTWDPLRGYIHQAGLKSGPRFINSRFSHTPATLRSLGEVINADWKQRQLIPTGYRLNICPPTVFNLVGLLFHREWSNTPTLELSAYFDDRGNATGLTVGSNEPGDFSYVRRLDVDRDLSRLGFRMALVPDARR